ncbi:MAG: NAD(P)H-binding protein [Steroidobacteraceae bacterium]
MPAAQKNKLIDPARTARVALVAGANGMVGQELLRLLSGVDDYARVIALSRRPLTFELPKLANRIVAFEKLAEQLKGLVCHDAYCCLGTTLHNAGSQAAFRAVDIELVVAFARVARANGAQRLIVVSSVGADPHSKNFYLRVKGEAEQAVGSIGFPAVDLLQPSLITGPRRELRPLEWLARVTVPLLNPLLMGLLARYRTIPAGDVAMAALGAARSARRGINVYGGGTLRTLVIRTRSTTSTRQGL